MKAEDLPAYSRFADLYDVAYRFVDYQGATAWLLEAIRRRHVEARSLLEVACGTGRYLELLGAHFEVSGLDSSSQMLQHARRRVPGASLFEGDMADFCLDRRFDVVCCLFRSIGYVGTVERLTAAIAAMSRHLKPGGLLIIEPFFTPDSYWANRVTLNEHRDDERTLAWMYVSERTADKARFRMHCLVGTRTGVEHFVENHEFGLFSVGDFRTAFANAGLDFEHEPSHPGGTGVHFGRAPAHLRSAV